MPFYGDKAILRHSTPLKPDPFSVQEQDRVVLAVEGRPVKFNIAARSLLHIEQGGSKVIVLLPGTVTEERRQGEIGGQQQNGRCVPAAGNGEEDLFVPILCAEVNQGQDPEQGEEDGKRVVRPEQAEVGHLPAEGREEVYPVRPFDLHGVQEQVQKAVQGQEQEDPAAVTGQQGNGAGEQKAAEQGCLDDGIKTKSKRVDREVQGKENPLHDPGHIRNDAAHRDPFDVRVLEQAAAGQGLDAKMGKGVGHDVSLPVGKIHFRVQLQQGVSIL